MLFGVDRINEPAAAYAKPGVAEGDAHQRRACDGLLQFPGSEYRSILKAGVWSICRIHCLLESQMQAGACVQQFFLDQNPTNALATGDSQTFNVTVFQPMRGGAAVARDARVDRSARQSRRRHQARQQS
jgi:hypothetical protein